MREGWKEMTIGEIADVIGGGTPSTKEDAFWNGKIPWITPYDLSNHTSKYISEGGRTITELGLKKSSAKLHPKNTILLTSRAPIGYLAIAKNEISTNQGFQCLICDEELVDPNFIYYSLQVFMIKIKAIASGATFPEVSGKKVRRIKLPIPPLETQRKIASILSGYDDLIENNLKRIKILEEMAQQTYEEWFVRMRFPGYETAVINKETGLPEGWEKVKLGKLWEIQSSKRIYLSDYVEFGIPFFRGKEISQKGGNSNVSDLLYISELKFNELKSKFGAPKAGDILLTAVGTLGNLYMVKQTDDEFYFKDGNLIWLKFNSTYSSYFLLYTLKNSSFQNHLNNIAIGSSQKALTIKGLKESEIIYPINEIIMDFDRITKPINLSIENFQSQNQRLREARDLLLPRLMMGIVEV